MVLDVEDHVRAELLGDVLVDERVVRRGVAAHQVHRGPVFLAVGVVEREPREVLEFLRQVLVAGHRALAVEIAHLRARAARTRVREQREVFARLKAKRLRLLRVHGERAELDEVVAASARAELRPRLVAQPVRHRRNAPVFVHHVVLAALLELAAHAEARLALDEVRETIALAGEGVRLAVIDGELHAARDVHADGVRNARAEAHSANAER